ncbi:uncharacterized protein LOC106175563 [Lingula anatina]|uniref:Uncharacterized protein LOC106175563 n=1 Tax=Lingula anatina TaxID=7574 RepID=A0A1S3JRU9_LINAN|nr:uncharacterized protein LOC106175563 [Lingula anatina]|eukprot:XP_013413085.1 uncharacterized protein LOC106175563 [Lingula anatina]
MVCLRGGCIGEASKPYGVSLSSKTLKENKRKEKGDETLKTRNVKTNRLDSKEYSDLIVLGLPWNSTEDLASQSTWHRFSSVPMRHTWRCHWSRILGATTPQPRPKCCGCGTKRPSYRLRQGSFPEIMLERRNHQSSPKCANVQHYMSLATSPCSHFH